MAVGFVGADGNALGLLGDLAVLVESDDVDLVVIDGAEPLLRARAFAGIGLYEHERGAWANEQMAALAEARDTARFRRLDLEALAES